MEQLSLLDVFERKEVARPLKSETEDILTNEDIQHLKEKILIESVKSAFGESRGGQRRRPSDEAWEWITTDERELPFSFKECCLAYGVDPEKMLDWLRYYKRKFLS